MCVCQTLRLQVDMPHGQSEEDPGRGRMYEMGGTATPSLGQRARHTDAAAARATQN